MLPASRVVARAMPLVTDVDVRAVFDNSRTNARPPDTDSIFQPEVGKGRRRSFGWKMF